jgi:hypothetical protein
LCRGLAAADTKSERNRRSAKKFSALGGKMNAGLASSEGSRESGVNVVIETLSEPTSGVYANSTGADYTNGTSFAA